MSIYFDIISGNRRGPLAGLARAGLRALSLPYTAAVAARNHYHDYFANLQWLDRPCISIGNLTTGGTGKTPLVIWLARELIRDGRKVGIISRGYKRDQHGSDELQLVSEACPQAVCVANPDRVTGGHYAVQVHDVDVVLLDDAFQHRRLGRDLDIVLIDASCPMGHGYLLPRGLLREPAAALRRADLIVITRLSLTTPQQLAELKTQCTQLAEDARIIGCDIRATGVVDPEGTVSQLTQLLDRTVVAFAGVGNPRGFTHTLTRIGAKPLRTLPYPDHHHYSRTDCATIAKTARRAGAELLITTEKDMVKLRRLNYDWPVPLRSLQIAVDFAADGGKLLKDLVDELFSEDGGGDVAEPIPTD